ncbi:MAG: molecular chaperone HscB [Cocleimonas sp.]|jgi:molecular chaperone HscB
MLDFNQSYFKLFGLSEQFALDTSILATSFRELQAQYHPDRFVNADDQERRVALQSTGFINEAHEALKSPRLRARYLLTLKGVEFDDEIDTTSDGMFLMQQMEMREALEDAQSASDDPEVVLDAIEKTGKEVKALSQSLQNDFEINFDIDNFVAAKEAVLKMKFFERLSNEVKILTEKLEDDMF